MTDLRRIKRAIAALVGARIGTRVDDSQCAEIGKRFHDNPQVPDDRPEYHRCGARQVFVAEVDGQLFVMHGHFTTEPGSRQKFMSEMTALGLDVDVSGLNDSAFGESHQLTAAFTGYPNADAARQEARRMFLSWANEHPTEGIIEATGWGNSIVAAVKDDDDLDVVQIKPDRSIVIESRADVLAAFTLYSQRVTELAAEIENNPGPYAFSNPVFSKLAAAWLLRDAADAALYRTREILKVRLTTAVEMADKHQVELNWSHLADNLHTDRANLYKLMPTRRKAGQT